MSAGLDGPDDSSIRNYTWDRQRHRVASLQLAIAVVQCSSMEWTRALACATSVWKFETKEARDHG